MPMWNAQIQFSVLTRIQDSSPIKDVSQNIVVGDIQ